MSISQKHSKRKASGGRYKKSIKKLPTLGNLPSLTKINKKKLKIKRIRGGHKKLTLLSINKINIIDKKSKKSQITEITSIMENPANRHYVRRGILTKGTIIQTKIGKAKITSRPGQEGTINATLI